jgi:thioredoxin 1
MEKGEGPALSAKYGVRAYPSLFFIDSDGQVVKSALGYQNVNKLLKLGEDALK